MKLFYRILLKLLFNLIYGEVKNRKEKYNKKLRLITLKFYNKNYKLFEIEQGRIFTDCNTNVAYISQNNNLMNFSFSIRRVPVRKKYSKKLNKNKGA